MPVHTGTSQFTVTTRLLRPVTCQAATPCPLVVVVGDREAEPVPDWESAGESLAQATGAVVLLFNLPGTGAGGMKSGGNNDYGGDQHVSAVKEVIRLTCSKSRPYIDRERCGYLTVGFGLVPTARALQIHGQGSLKSIQFLLDVEGPTDRCAITQAPAEVSKGIGPDDGPGISETACNFGIGAPLLTFENRTRVF